MLHGVINSQLQIMEFLKTVMLKGVEYIVDLAFRKAIPGTIANYQKQCVSKD